LICLFRTNNGIDNFQKALPEARRQGIRFIALNRRTFPGSTPFSQEELEEISPSKLNASTMVEFMHKRAMEIVGFVHGVIKQLDLPGKISEEGGISVLGWSLGSLYCFAFINACNDPHLPDEWKKTIKECVSSVILYGQ
jgi:pimeloyl-ACP methyl ester carboxylesterase